MSNILTIAYATEGTTDQRFLSSIIKRTFEEVAYTCDGLIEVYDPVCLESPKKGSFSENILALSVKAFDSGLNVLCVHVDADSDNDDEVLKHKMDPAFKNVYDLEGNACKNLVAIIPVYMSEAWMLADKDLLKEEIGTPKSDADLDLLRAPELIADPKFTIENALRIAQIELPKRRRRLSIGELYQPVGQKITIQKLEQLRSFQKFRLSVEDAFRKLNFLH